MANTHGSTSNTLALRQNESDVIMMIRRMK